MIATRLGRAGARAMTDRLQLHVHDLEVMVLTGIYSEETHLPQPLQDFGDGRSRPAGAIRARYAAQRIEELSRSETRRDDRAAAGVHFKLVEAVAEHICETLFLQDKRVARVEVKIVKLAIAEAGESIGITLVRHRR